jgi:hypothetical protein
MQLIGGIVKLKRFTRGKAAPMPVEPVPQGRAQLLVARVTPLTATAAERLNAATVLISPYAVSAAGRVVPLATTAAGRVVPLAQSAAGRVGPLATHAVGRVTPYTQQAVGLVSPYAQQAAERVTPLAHQAAEFVAPYAHQAADFVTPYAQKVGPLATAAKERGVQGVHDAVGAVVPKLEEALAGVTPAVDAARGKVTDDLLPRIGGVLTSAAAAPVVVEATKRGRATMAAARGELSLPEPVAQPKGQVLKRLGIIAVLIGVAAVVVKKMLGSADADWQAARPTTPYVPATPPAAPASTSGAQTAAHDVADLPTDAVEPAGQTPLTDVPAAATTGATSETGSVWTEGDVSGAGKDSFAGAGAYVGSEPPEGFVIKGNENSMKYHTPESGGYSETVAEVWFSSEEAAQEAGFVRAQG